MGHLSYEESKKVVFKGLILLGIITLVLTINEINSWLQGLLIIATLVYTIIKIIQLLKSK